MYPNNAVYSVFNVFTSLSLHDNQEREVLGSRLRERVPGSSDDGLACVPEEGARGRAHAGADPGLNGRVSTQLIQKGSLFLKYNL